MEGRVLGRCPLGLRQDQGVRLDQGDTSSVEQLRRSGCATPQPIGRAPCLAIGVEECIVLGEIVSECFEGEGPIAKKNDKGVIERKQSRGQGPLPQAL